MILSWPKRKSIPLNIFIFQIVYQFGLKEKSQMKHIVSWMKEDSLIFASFMQAMNRYIEFERFVYRNKNEKREKERGRKRNMFLVNHVINNK